MAKEQQHVHLIGIGGTGLSAIARVLIEQGYQVSGSDRALSPLAKELQAAGAKVYVGHAAENIRGASLVLRSSAVQESNVEAQAALAAGIPVLKRSEFLPMLMEGKRVIAVAGTHGKTTTTAMIAWLLWRLGLDPSYIIGGTSKNLGSNARAGKGPFFVIEADEYDRMFLGLEPDLIVITNVEHDHPDCYPSMDDYLGAFKEFVWQLRPNGSLLLSHDDPMVRILQNFAPQDVTACTYGFDAGATYTANQRIRNEHGGFDYDACWTTPGGKEITLGAVSLQVPGEHNIRNSLAALAAIHRLSISDRAVFDAISAASSAARAAAVLLDEFQGTGRRFEVLGVVNDITIIDDYGHHPTEILSTLAGARARYPQSRIWAVWQPHTFSRTIELQKGFLTAFKDADRVLVTEIYPSREKAENFGRYSASRIVEQMTHQGAQFTGTLANTTATLLNELRPGDVLLVFSAGDADQVSAQVLAALQSTEAR